MRLQPWLMPCIGAPAADDSLRVVLSYAREATSELYSLRRGSFSTVLTLSESNAKTGGKGQDRTAMGDLTRQGGVPVVCAAPARMRKLFACDFNR